MNSDLWETIEEQRKAKGYLGGLEILDLCKKGNVILDPWSTLISASANIGSNNVFYPGVIIELCGDGKIEIGDNNTFYPQSFLLADRGGQLVIGNNNQFGDGGLTIKANFPNSEINIGDNGRYLNGVQILGRTTLGSGSQIIGGIVTVQNCDLGAGETFQHDDPDLRAGVLKGFGLARNITVGQGKVLNGQGTFEESAIQDQSFYHPKKK